MWTLTCSDILDLVERTVTSRVAAPKIVGALDVVPCSLVLPSLSNAFVFWTVSSASSFDLARLAKLGRVFLMFFSTKLRCIPVATDS